MSARSLHQLDIDRYKRACRDDFTFYREEQLCIRPKKPEEADADGLMAFRTLKKGQAKIWAEIERQLSERGRVLLDIFKARQVGSTTLSAAIATWIVFNRENRHGSMASASVEMTDIIYDIVRIMAANHNRGRVKQANIPWPEIEKLNDNLLKLKNGSQIRVATAGEGGRRKALFRGMSPNFIHATEIAFWANAVGFMDMVQALNTNDGSGAIAIRESTSNGTVGIGKYWYDVYLSHVENRTDWDMIFISWMDDDDSVAVPDPYTAQAFAEWKQSMAAGYVDQSEVIAQRIMQRMRFTEYERELALVHGATIAQLTWYDRILRQKYEGSDDERAVMRCQEFPSTIEESFQFMGDSTFPVAKLMELLKLSPPPTICSVGYERISSAPRLAGGKIVAPGGVIVQTGPCTEAYDVDETILPRDGFVYEDEERNLFALRARPDSDGLWSLFEEFDHKYEGRYAIGIDAASGSGADTADSTCVVVMRYDPTIDTYFECASCEMQGVVPDDAADMMVGGLHYYRSPVVNVERPGPGEQILLRLQRAHGYTNFYRRRGTNSFGSSTDVGWRQTEEARRFLIATTRSLLLRKRLVLRSKVAIDQFMGMRRRKKRDGTAKDTHARFGHDDMVFAAMLSVVCNQDYTPSTMRRVNARNVMTIQGMDFHRIEFEKLSKQTHFHPTFLNIVRGLGKRG